MGHPRVSSRSRRAPTWLVPSLLLVTSGLVLLGKGYPGIDRGAAGLEGLEAVEGVTDPVPLAAVRAAVERSGQAWPEEARGVLLFVLGTQVCAGCLAEVDDYQSYLGGTGVVPLALCLSGSTPEAERFARVIELATPAVPSADPVLLDAFGFSAERPSRQLALLLDPETGRVRRQALVPTAITPPEFKHAFLRP